MGERLCQPLRVTDEHGAAVVRNVQPLVAVNRHGAGTFDSLCQVTGPRRDPGEQPECAIDVQPGVVLVGEVRHPGDRVEHTGIGFPGSGNENRRAVTEMFKTVTHCLQVRVAGAVGRMLFGPRMPETQHAKGFERARVHVTTYQHKGRVVADTIPSDVDSSALPCPLSSRRQPGEVSHRGAGGEDAAP